MAFVLSIRRFYLQSWMSFRALFGWLNPMAYALIKIITPILQMIFFSLLAQYVFETSDITPWIIGNAILLCSKNAVYGVGRVLLEEKSLGTLKIIIASPCNKFFVFMGRGFMHIFDAMITVSVGLLVGIVFFHFRMPAENIIHFIVAIIVCMYSAMAFGQIIACVGLVYRDGHMLLNVSEYLMLILTGASFPLQRLPEALQHVSNFMPLTRGIAAARLLATSADVDTVNKLLIQEFGVGSVCLLLSYFTFRYFELLSRQKATLDLD